MCGIYGSITKEKNATALVMDGLKKLEYRGYDSAGLAYLQKGSIAFIKKQGELYKLQEAIQSVDTSTNIAIGHTRWATHGKPSENNSHPHISSTGGIAVVHNGIIENFLSLKNFLISEGFAFRSQTDSEVICNLMAYHMQKADSFSALQKTVQSLQGSFAICVLVRGEKNIYAARKDSPLVVANLADGNIAVSSDVQALVSPEKVFVMGNLSLAKLAQGTIEFFDFLGKSIINQEAHVSFEGETELLGGYKHLMEKEMAEIESGLQATYAAVKNNTHLDKIRIKNADLFYFIGCGTAYHACLNAQLILQSEGILAYSEIASEFRFNKPFLTDKSVCVFVSQSGETADTLKALEFAKSKGAYCIAVTNIKSSSIHFAADACLYTRAGPERAVAATKSFCAQLLALYLLTEYICRSKNKKTCIPWHMHKLLKQNVRKKEDIKLLAQKLSDAGAIFFLGKVFDLVASKEGSLKVKEISYIHSEAFASGELKHGTLALVNGQSVIVATAFDETVLDKTQNAMSEVKSRGAQVLVISCFAQSRFNKKDYDYFIRLPKVHPYFSPLIAVRPMQKLAYYLSLQRGLNPDKPRNLAKSVTVE